MKLILTLITVLLFFTAPAFSQLSETDLNKIRLVVKEEVETAIDASEKRMKEYVSQEIGKVDIKISEMDKRLTGKIEALDKNLTDKIEALEKDLSGDMETLGNRLNNIFLLTLGLLAFIAVVVGVP